MTQEQQQFITELTLLKDKTMRLKLYRTGRLLEIPIQEVGWEAGGMDTPDYQKARQQETLTP